MDISVLETFLNKIVNYLPTLGIAIILLIIGLIVRKIIVGIIRKALDKGKLDKTVKGFIVSASDVVIVALVCIIVLSTLGIPMTSIIAVFTAAGLAISLALQNSLSNVAGGFIILTTKPFKSGEYISATGIEGTVDEITILTTKIVTLDNKDVFVPNGTLSGSAITNYTREGKRRVDKVFTVSGENDYEKVKKVIEGAVNKTEHIIKDPAPFIRISDVVGGSVDIACRVWTTSDEYWDVYHDLTENVKTAFDKNGVIAPYQAYKNV